MLDQLLILALLTQGQWNPTRSIEVPSASEVEIADNGVSCGDIDVSNAPAASEPLPCDVENWRKKVAAQYPYDALRVGAEGTVELEGMVGTDGHFTECNVVKTSGSNVLDQKACLSMREHARFLPAINAQGEAVSSTFKARVGYRMPEWPSDNERFSREVVPRDVEKWLTRIQENYPMTTIGQDLSGTVGIKALIAPNGRAIYCEVTASSGKSITDKAACLGMLRYSRFDPALDASGKPTLGAYETQITYKHY